MHPGIFNVNSFGGAMHGSRILYTWVCVFYHNMAIN